MLIPFPIIFYGQTHLAALMFTLDCWAHWQACYQPGTILQYNFYKLDFYYINIESFLKLSIFLSYFTSNAFLKTRI